MAQLTEDQINTKISAIDTQLDAIVASPDANVDYFIGTKRVMKHQKVEFLMKLRQLYQNLLGLIPYEAVKQFDIVIDEFGQDQSEYVGDEFV